MQSQLRNNILARIDAEDFAILADYLEPCKLSRSNVLCEANQPIPYVIFPEVGVISVVVVSPEGQNAEAGVIGREGYAVPTVVLGTDRGPTRIEVQMGGTANRIETARFVEAVRQREKLRTVALRFAQNLMTQTTYTAMSNATHPLDERLARWLLMCHDRSDSDDLGLTHRFMSVMLSVRRASVTVALQVLEGHGFIRAERGYVTIAKRAALEEFAADAYGMAEAEYTRLLGPLRSTGSAAQGISQVP